MKTKRNEKRNTDEESVRWGDVRWNLHGQAYYRLGEVQAAMRLFESMWNATDQSTTKEKRLLQKVFDALTRYDGEVRSRMRKEGLLR